MNTHHSSVRPLCPVSSGHASGSASKEMPMRESAGAGSEEALKEADESREDPAALGERLPKVGRRPNVPTRKEIDEHFPLHVHYRSWCPHCQAGRSTSKQHIGSQEDEV